MRFLKKKFENLFTLCVLDFCLQDKQDMGVSRKRAITEVKEGISFKSTAKLASLKKISIHYQMTLASGRIF